MPRGGKRPGAGRRKGSKNKRTVLREKTLEKHQGDADELFEMLIAMARSLVTEPGLRRMCINDVLAYVWGKPVQRSEGELDASLLLLIEETEDWRGNGQDNNGAQAAPGPEGDISSSGEVQVAGGGTQVAKDDAGHEGGA